MYIYCINKEIRHVRAKRGNSQPCIGSVAEFKSSVEQETQMEIMHILRKATTNNAPKVRAVPQNDKGEKFMASGSPIAQASEEIIELLPLEEYKELLLRDIKKES